jgi:PAS domain S-box-containing protein
MADSFFYSVAGKLTPMSVIEDNAARTLLVRLLLVENNPGDRRLFEEYCKDLTIPLHVVVEDTLEKALQCVKEQRFDILFLNVFLENTYSLEAIRNLREVLPDVPIIVLFGLDNEALALQALRFGADDCVSKAELNGTVLQRTILYSIERKNTLVYQTKYLQLETILASFLEHAWAISPQGETLYMSLGSEAIYGYTIKQFFNNANLWYEVIHPDDKPLLENYWATLRELGRYELYYRIIRADGNIRLLHDRARAVYDNQGNVLRFEGLVRDRTDDLDPAHQQRSSQNSVASRQ